MAEVLSEAALEVMEAHFSEECEDKAEQSLRRLMLSHCRALRATLATVEAERDGLKRDAERFAWIKANKGQFQGLVEYWGWRLFDTVVACIDEEIDQQLQEPTT